MTQELETRKLAAVMFADIEGYTSMFQRDETAGLEQIKSHREYLADVVAKFHGTIIQYFGDGSLTVFDSVIDAVHCAIQLQLESRRKAIPLRIGIHIGDLVFRDNDVFGDVVNVASRIQSAGIAGSVILSKKVADELSNQPDIKVRELGFFNLKNVKDAQDLYAIDAPGLIVPGRHHVIRKKWSKAIKFSSLLLPVILAVAYFFREHIPILQTHTFSEERIIVLPFENRTLNKELDIYSELAREWLNNDLIHNAEAHVLNDESVIFFTNADINILSKNPELARRLGADLMVKGSFSYAGKNRDSLLFLASIIDTRTQNILPVRIPKTYCIVTDPRACFRELSNSIYGFWRTKDTHLFSHPTNEAYEAFLKARQKWAEPTKDEAIQYLRESIQLDTTFLNAYFLLLDGFYNEGAPQNAADTIKLIRTRFPKLNTFQENFLKYYEEDLNGRRKVAFNHFLTEYHKEPQDLFKNTSAMVMAIEYLNDPLTALSFNKQIDSEIYDLNTCHYCRTRLLMAMIAYRSISDISNALKLADRLKLQPMRASEFSRLVEFYISIGDTLSVESILGRLNFDREQVKMVPFLTFTAARQSLLSGNLKQKDMYASRAAKLYSAGAGRMYARCLYLLNDLVGAEQVYLNVIEKGNAGIRTYGELGLIYARQGQEKKAREAIINIQKLEEPYFYGEVKYLVARILAHLGNKKEAIEYLSDALDEGCLYSNGITFQYDPDLIILNTEPAYLNLLAKNRLNKFPK